MIDGELVDVKLFKLAELQLEFADGDPADGESADGRGSEGDGADSQRASSSGAEFDEGSCAWAKSHAGIVERVCRPRILQDSLEGMSEGFPRLYAIVDRRTLDTRGIGVREFARELRAAGVRLVQYRDKANGSSTPANGFAGDSGPQEILRAANEIDEAFKGAEVTRIMNDRADLAVLAGWDGVHVGQGDLGVEAARRVLLGAGGKIQGSLHSGLRPPVEMTTSGIVGISTHNEEQVRAAVEPMSQNRDMGHPDSWPDYVAVGPVFQTVSKANAEPVVGLAMVRRARALTELPVVAIGGITLANARSVIEAGADAVAVIGGLLVEGRKVSEVARDFLEVLG